MNKGDVVMLVRCVDADLTDNKLELGRTYMAFDDMLEPLSEMAWHYLKGYDMIKVQTPDGSMHSFPVWRFKEESFFKAHDIDLDSITLREELEAKPIEAINLDIPCPITIGEFEKLDKEFDRLMQKEEKVNHPSHYNQGKYEVIDVIEDWNLGFNLGNTIKYIGRAGHKDNIIQDLRKAMWYLQREIDRLEKLWDEEMEI